MLRAIRAIRAIISTTPSPEAAAAATTTVLGRAFGRPASRSRRAPHSRRRQHRRQRAHAARRRPASQTNGSGVEASSTTAVTRVFRAMSSSEYHYTLEHGYLGRHPSFPGRVFAGLTRRTHHLPLEHSKRNNSSSMTSYAMSEGHANGYVAYGRYVVVESNLPPVFAVLADDYLNYPTTYEALLRQYQSEEDYHADGAHKIDTINEARYHYIIKSAEIMGIACPTDDSLVDYRPRVSESVRSVLHVHRGMRSATVDGPHFFRGASHIRPWAIQVSCPYSEPHLVEMNRGAVKRRAIPHGTRLLTMEDAKVLFPILSEQFPLMHTTELDVPCKLRYVPAHCQPGSPEMVEHCVKQVADHLTNHATFQPTAAGSPPSTRVRR